MNEILYSRVCFSVPFFFKFVRLFYLKKKKSLAKRGQLALLQSDRGEL